MNSETVISLRNKSIRTHEFEQYRNDLLVTELERFAQAVVLIYLKNKAKAKQVQSSFESWNCMVFTADSIFSARHWLLEYPVHIVVTDVPRFIAAAYDVVVRSDLYKHSPELLFVCDQARCGDFDSLLATGATGLILWPPRWSEVKSQVRQILRRVTSLD